MRFYRFATALALLAALPLGASAHTGVDGGLHHGLVTGFLHPLTGADARQDIDHAVKSARVTNLARGRPVGARVPERVPAPGRAARRGARPVRVRVHVPVPRLVLRARWGQHVRVAGAVVRETRLGRLLFAGGDTSSHGVAQLGIDALTWAAPIEPGAPLVRAHAADPAIDGLELVLKGGQMGGEGFFETVRRGG